MLLTQVHSHSLGICHHSGHGPLLALNVIFEKDILSPARYVVFVSTLFQLVPSYTLSTSFVVSYQRAHSDGLDGAVVQADMAF